MFRPIAIAALTLSTAALLAQSPTPRPKFDAFEVATIKPADPSEPGRYITMKGNDRFVAIQYNLKLLIAAAFDVSPRTISGAPSWIDSEHFDILAVTPGDIRPTHDQQMAMLRTLITERFKLTFHREPKEYSIYQLELAPDGPKMKPSTAPPDDPTQLISTVYPDHVELPAHNATMRDFVSLLQRAVFDRPVVDKTNLTPRYDFDLIWAPDETQFGGALPVAPSDAPSPPLFTALQQQLGLRLVATRGPVDAFIIDKVEHPSAN